MIDWVRVERYKCLKEVETACGLFNVLIGKNDTGKTSFLEALRELRYWSTGNAGPVAKRAIRGQRGPGLFVKVNGRHFGGHNEPDGWKSLHGPQSMQASLMAMPPWNADPWISIRGDLGVSDPLCIDPPQIANASQTLLASLQNLIASRGQGTAAHFAALALADREAFDKAESTLRDSTGGRIRNIVVKDTGGGNYLLHYRLYDGTIIPASDASQGILVFTCFLALVYRDDAPSVLLIEEPENGVHPLRLKEIVDLIRTLTERGVQVFLTTHSPDLLTWCKPEEVLVFWRPDKDSGTSIHKLPADFNERVAMGDSLGQIWASRGEEGLLDMLGTPRPFVREPAS